MYCRIVSWCAVVSLVACAESPSASRSETKAESGATAGYFRAVSLDGQSLPVASSQASIETGDLVLLEDGTIRAQMAGGAFEFGQPILEGTWKLDAGTLTITSVDRASTRTGQLSGDSIVLTMPMQQQGASGSVIREQPVVFRRMTPDAVAIEKGVYALQDNSAHADTITFHDGAFYKRKHSANGLTREFWGAYRGRGEEVVLLSSMSGLDDEPATTADTLQVSKDALTRAGHSDRYKKQ
jgi:hypothetical protein